MMMRFVGATLILLSAGTLGGCGRVGFGDMGGFGSPQPQARYEPLPASPTKPVVTQGDLQPLPPVPGQEQPVAGEPVPPPGEAVAAVPTPAAATPEPSADKAVSVGRTDLLGGWKIASGGDNCQLFMTLTTWSGGYRATTRGCNTPHLQKISAWDLSGKQVSLKGADGGTIATLYGSGAERFNGQTTERQAVSLSR
jgi:hypothetical protein